MGKWRGIMRITELVHSDRFGNVIETRRDLPNTIHLLGEEFVLGVLFAGVAVPGNYYMGLDSRQSIYASDSISDLEGPEPVGNGYERKSIESDNFSISSAGPNARRADSPVVLFTASGGSWTVRNVFLATGLGYDMGSVLVSSAAIGQEIQVSSGETISMRMAMSLS